MPPLLHRQAEAGRHRRTGGALRAALRAAGKEVVFNAGQPDQLRAAKLRALVKEKVDPARAVPSVLRGGAALLVQGSSGAAESAWVLIDDGVVSRFGAALAWSMRQGASKLDVIVDEPASTVVGSGGAAAGVVARRAAAFGGDIDVWSVDGISLVPATPSTASPLWFEAEDPPPEVLVELLQRHGLEVIWEHGVLRGEVLGLEVARTVDSQLLVGVGLHDRMARFEMRPGESLSAALDEAAGAVRQLRRSGAPAHPANALARSRWLRSLLVATPSAYGFEVLRPVAPPLPWFDLSDAGAAPSVGVLAESGEPVVVVCSVGVDLDLVPTAADCWLLYGEPAGPGSKLRLVVPEGDDLPVTRAMAARLSPAATVMTVPRGWEAGPISA